MIDLIVLSPHLDDAVLSCGGRIAATVGAGRRVLVVTLFAAEEPAESANPLAEELRARFGLPAGEVVARRRAEDRSACAALGAEPLHLELPEALYRTDLDGRPLYATLAALYGDVAAAEGHLAKQLSARLLELPPAALLLAPLGVGGHVDHRLTRAAAEASGRRHACYEEFPYAEWKWFAVRRALGRPRDWRSESMPLSAALLEARREAILHYRSQVPLLFRSPGRLGKQLRRHARRAGGERIWWPRSTAPAAPR